MSDLLAWNAPKDSSAAVSLPAEEQPWIGFICNSFMSSLSLGLLLLHSLQQTTGMPCKSNSLCFIIWLLLTNHAHYRIIAESGSNKASSCSTQARRAHRKQQTYWKIPGGCSNLFRFTAFDCRISFQCVFCLALLKNMLTRARPPASNS